MDLKGLSYFIAVFEEKNITAAAQRCHISQPSISAAIVKLEKKLKSNLFERHKKGVTPTRSAEKLYLVSRKLLNDAAAIEAMFKPDHRNQHFTLGLMTALDLRRAIPLIKGIINDNEGLNLQLVGAAEKCDARIICLQDKKPDETFIPLWAERFILALPEGHPLTLKDELLINDVCNVPLIARDYCNSALMDGAKAMGIEFNVVETAMSEEWAVALVAAGVGAAFLPEGYISADSKVAIHSIANMEITRKVGLAYTSDKFQSVVLTQLIKDCSVVR